MRTPDHSTIAEFRKRHESEIGELFEEVLGLCQEAGLVSVGVIAIDGTKVKANASMDANRTYRQVVRRSCGRTMRSTAGRMSSTATRAEMSWPSARTRTPRTKLKRRMAARTRWVRMDPERFVTRSWGRRNWLREARRELENQRGQDARPVPRDRDERLLDGARRLEENLQVEIAANDAYERWRREGSTRYRNSRRGDEPL